MRHIFSRLKSIAHYNHPIRTYFSSIPIPPAIEADLDEEHLQDEVQPIAASHPFHDLASQQATNQQRDEDEDEDESADIQVQALQQYLAVLEQEPEDEEEQTIEQSFAEGNQDLLNVFLYDNYNEDKSAHPIFKTPEQLAHGLRSAMSQFELVTHNSIIDLMIEKINDHNQVSLKHAEINENVNTYSKYYLDAGISFLNYKIYKKIFESKNFNQIRELIRRGAFEQNKFVGYVQFQQVFREVLPSESYQALKYPYLLNILCYETHLLEGKPLNPNQRKQFLNFRQYFHKILEIITHPDEVLDKNINKLRLLWALNKLYYNQNRQIVHQIVNQLTKVTLNQIDPFKCRKLNHYLLEQAFGNYPITNLIPLLLGICPTFNQFLKSFSLSLILLERIDLTHGLLHDNFSQFSQIFFLFENNLSKMLHKKILHTFFVDLVSSAKANRIQEQNYKNCLSFYSKGERGGRIFKRSLNGGIYNNEVKLNENKDDSFRIQITYADTFIQENRLNSNTIVFDNKVQEQEIHFMKIAEEKSSKLKSTKTWKISGNYPKEYLNEQEMVEQLLQGHYSQVYNYLVANYYPFLTQSKDKSRFLRKIEEKAEKMRFKNQHERGLFIMNEIVDEFVYELAPVPLTEQYIDEIKEDEEEQQDFRRIFQSQDQTDQLEKRFRHCYTDQKILGHELLREQDSTISQQKIFTKKRNIQELPNINSLNLDEEEGYEATDSQQTQKRFFSKKLSNNEEKPTMRLFQKNNSQTSDNNNHQEAKKKSSMKLFEKKKLNLDNQFSSSGGQGKVEQKANNSKLFFGNKNIQKYSTAGEKVANSEQEYQNYKKVRSSFEQSSLIPEMTGKSIVDKYLHETVPENVYKNLEKEQNLFEKVGGQTLARYLFLNGKARGQEAKESELKGNKSLRAEFVSSLGLIDKDYSQYIAKNVFRYGLNSKLYGKLLQEQEKYYQRHQFKAIVSHMIYYQQEIQQNQIRSIVHICESNRIGYTLVEIAQLIKLNSIILKPESLLILASSWQKFNTIHDDLIIYLKQYTKKMEIPMNLHYLTPFFVNLLKSKSYQKLKLIVNDLLQDLRQKSYKYNADKKADENAKLEKEFKQSENKRYSSAYLEVMEMVINNLHNNELPEFVEELMKEYKVEKRGELSDREYGLYVIAFCKNKEESELIGVTLREKPEYTTEYVYDSLVRAAQINTQLFETMFEEILNLTLFKHKFILSNAQLYNIIKVYKKSTNTGSFSKFLQHLLIYQENVSSNIKLKSDLFFILNNSDDDFAKGGILNLIDFIFNSKREKERMQLRELTNTQAEKSRQLSMINATATPIIQTKPKQVQVKKVQKEKKLSKKEKKENKSEEKLKEKGKEKQTKTKVKQQEQEQDQKDEDEQKDQNKWKKQKGQKLVDLGKVMMEKRVKEEGKKERKKSYDEKTELPVALLSAFDSESFTKIDDTPIEKNARIPKKYLRRSSLLGFSKTFMRDELPAEITSKLEQKKMIKKKEVDKSGKTPKKQEKVVKEVPKFAPKTKDGEEGKRIYKPEKVKQEKKEKKEKKK